MKSSALNLLIGTLLFAMAVSIGKSEEIPRSFFQTYGLMARSVWASYQKDGEFDMEGFASDCLAQEFGGALDASEFSTIVADLE